MSASGDRVSTVLTIAIPSYNAEHYLDNCLAHFIESNVLDYLEILIVNDGSTDSTPTIAEAYEREHPQSIRVISKPNAGYGSAINTAIPAATGRYFKVVDADDWVEPDALDHIIDVLSWTDADLVLSPFYMYNEETSVQQLDSKRFFRQYAPLETHDFSNLKIHAPISIHEIIFRTDMLQAHPKHIDERMYYVDAEYVLYNLADVSTFLVCDKPLYVYRYGSETQSVSHANLMKNVEQHRRAVISCLTYWNENLESFDAAHKRCFYRQLSGMVADHYRIFLDFRPSAGLRKAMPAWRTDSERLMTDHEKPSLGPLLTLMVHLDFRGLWVFCLINRLRLVAVQRVMTTFRNMSSVNEGYLDNLLGEQKTASHKRK